MSQAAQNLNWLITNFVDNTPGVSHTVVVSADGIRLTKKRFRSGRTLTWRALWEGGADELEGQPRPDGSA